MIRELLNEGQKKGPKHTLNPLDRDYSAIDCVRNISSFICSIITGLVMVLIAILVFKHGGSLIKCIGIILNAFYEAFSEICGIIADLFSTIAKISANT